MEKTMDRRDFGKMILAAAGGVLAGASIASAKTASSDESWGRERCSDKAKCKGKIVCYSKKKKKKVKKEKGAEKPVKKTVKKPVKK
jgi:hypothetical protein